MRCTLFTMLLLLLGQAIMAQPKLEIASSRFDFGIIPDQSTVKHSYWLKSVGTDTLRIKSISPSCKCTKVSPYRDWLAPGDSMPVSVYWELGRRVGNTSQFPEVLAEADPGPHFLGMTGLVAASPDIARPVSIKPFKAELAKTSSRSIDSISFVLTNHSNEDFGVQVVSFPVQECAVAFPDTLAAGAQATGYIKLESDYSDSVFKSSVTLEFEGERKSRLTIPIRRKIYGATP